VILTVFVLAANILGIGAALMLVTVAFPVPSVFSDAPAWITWVVCPAYIVLALMIGTFWLTRRTVNDLRWAIVERAPTRRPTQHLPGAVAGKAHLVLWGVGTALFTTLYGLQDTKFIPRFLFTISFAGVVVATACYLLTEFALRPVAAQALEAGPPPRRLTAGIMGRLMTVRFLASLPVIGIALLAVFSVSLKNLTPTQFTSAVWILAVVALLVGFILMWIVSWLTATPARVVWWYSTAPNSASCNADSTRWFTDCANANGSAICSAAMWAARWRRLPNSSAPSSAAKNATSQ
jgi:adenylate cyclase